MPDAIANLPRHDRTRFHVADGVAKAILTGACVGFATWMLVGPGPDEAGWDFIRRASLPYVPSPAGCDPSAASGSPGAAMASATRRTRAAGSATRNVLPSPGRLSMPSSAW